ncbi:MAG: hypothetical protein QM731_01800 [Chitinophagaceae bacterium]
MKYVLSILLTGLLSFNINTRYTINLSAKSIEVEYAKDHTVYKEKFPDATTRTVYKDEKGKFHTCDGKEVTVKVIEQGGSCDGVKLSVGSTRNIEGKVLSIDTNSIKIDGEDAWYIIHFTTSQFKMILNMQKTGEIGVDKSISLNVNITG